ncbi:MAG: chemotaxis-specific protein-glutamate methyltransferase CheB [Acidobacteriota bacterium]
MSGREATRVLLVDDSPTVRAVLRRLLAGGELEVVGEASNGAQAVEEARRLRPDVVLMDVEMPVLDGFAATEKIMEQCPTAILILTSRAHRDHVRTAFEAIRRGALDVLAKPEDAAGWEQLALTLPPLVRGAARARRQKAAEKPGMAPPATHYTAPATARVRFVAIGASTGGPGAVRDLLAELPPGVPAAVLIVQHIAAGFDGGFADWLARDLARDVQLARDGELAIPGTVRIAPVGAHLLLEAGGRLTLDAQSPPRRGHRPSADDLFFSCARVCPGEVAGVLLTGMGSDGAEGLAALRAAGGVTLVQDEASSVVFGMPRAALECGAASVALPPRALGRTLLGLWEGSGR